MARLTDGTYHARKLLLDLGFDHIIDIPIDLFASGLYEITGFDVIIVEEVLENCDGKIILGRSKAIIKVNSGIQFEGRKRFVIAHEIGHLIMHRHLQIADDLSSNFDMFSGIEETLKMGIQEVEANEFASELLMPQNAFISEARAKTFSPLLIKNLVEKFKTSITATTFKYVDANLHPICIVYIENERVKYWKKSNDMRVRLRDYIKLSPPQDSVAAEYIENNYDYIYSFEDKPQEIFKSTWFLLNEYDNEDSIFYEFCIPNKSFKTILSIIWEN
jgi:Zn-dependent peptidase ImmA (M78 family)